MRVIPKNAALGAALVLAISLHTTIARADVVDCERAIAKASSQFAVARMKTLQRCNDAVVAGTLRGPCPDGRASVKLAVAYSKLRAAVDARCGGPDRSCGTGFDDLALAGIGWDIGTCPNFENGSCTNPIGDCDAVSDCLICDGGAAVDQAIALYYDDLQPSVPGSALLKCQRAIGKEAASFFVGKLKALQKCENRVLQGAIPGPCPDAATAAPTITAAESKMIARICYACGGADQACGGSDDFTPAAIGFPANCPGVAVPGGPACGGLVVTLADLVACIDCVTEFKTDCMDALAVPTLRAYPSECNPAPTATVTRTPTPSPTVTFPASTPTETRTATPTPTVTCMPNAAGCGNCVVDAGEDCDPPGSATCPGGNGLQFCDASCHCDCPAKIEFVGTAGNLGVLDTGWTGQAHNSQVVSDGKVTVSVVAGTCTGSVPAGSNRRNPVCGTCNLSGPIPNVDADAGDINNRRCTGDTRVKCTTTAPDCTAAGGTCEFYFGTYLPLSAGGVATCVGNQIDGAITGTTNIETGDAATTANLISRVYSGPTADNPCPHCLGDGAANDGIRGGTCQGGKNDTLTCDVNGESPNIYHGKTSLDCPPADLGLIATLPIDLTNSTGLRSRTLSAANPFCRATGFTMAQCFCDTCNNAAATPCTTNADCTAIGATVCGGKRCRGGANNGAPCTTGSQCPGTLSCGVPGFATAYNQCGDATCSPISACVGGSNPGTRCAVNSECSGGTCATDTCVGGANTGVPCAVNSECPGGSCAVGYEGECAGGPFELFCGPTATFKSCTSDAECAPFNECVGGSNAGAVCLPGEGICMGGSNAGANCGPGQFICIGGPNSGKTCSAVPGCPSGTCLPTLVCIGGPNSGATCLVASECADGICLPPCPGGTCETFCVGGTCGSRFGGSPERCTVGKNRDCFTDNGLIGSSVNAMGFADPPVADTSYPTLAALFCVGPTSSSAVNSAAGLPGLGKLELPGHASGLP